jgi:hypothetical protein
MCVKGDSTFHFIFKEVKACCQEQKMGGTGTVYVAASDTLQKIITVTIILFFQLDD